jgi:hypothetical protein
MIFIIVCRIPPTTGVPQARHNTIIRSPLTHHPNNNSQRGAVKSYRTEQQQRLDYYLIDSYHIYHSLP